MVEVPAGVLPPTRTSIVAVPLPPIEGGVNVAAVFEGNPVADRATDPPKPLTAVTVTE